jgi:hypothetical protein
MADTTTTPTQPTTPADVQAVDSNVTRSSDALGYGITDGGFVPKPFARLLAEKLALARALFGNDIDIGAGSALRKILEIGALEDARTWSALAALYDDQFVATARGDALSRLGDELGLPRPFLEARGTIRLTAALPANISGISLPRGARLLTPGRHHVALDETVTLSRDSPVHDVAVVAFYPGPSHNLDPAIASQKITWWNQDDPKLAWDASSLLSLARSLDPNVAPEQLVQIAHTQPLTGGELRWPDARYRSLVLQAPRSIWTVESIRLALSQVPGVRQVQVRDRVGGLDVDLPIFGTVAFLERMFGAERDLATPYLFDVIVASTESAIWDGPDGLAASLDDAMEDLRPLGIRPSVQPADPVQVGISAQILATGLPLPRVASSQSVNDTPAAIALKQRIVARVGNYIGALALGEPVRFAEVMWAIMSEPGVADVRNLKLMRFPPATDGSSVGATNNVPVRPTQIATFVDSDQNLRIL